MFSLGPQELPDLIVTSRRVNHTAPMSVPI